MTKDISSGLNAQKNGQTAEIILAQAEVQQVFSRLSVAIAEFAATSGPLAVIGIRRGGEYLASRLRDFLQSKLKLQIPMGLVDITLYRDDGFGPHTWPQVGLTDIAFDVSNYTILLVDDVLYTGRTVRAALDVLLEYGRPRAVRLAVLIDRGCHELPIRADFVGQTVETSPAEHVRVCWQESGAVEDQVILEKCSAPKSSVKNSVAKKVGPKNA